ncbi:MAG: ribosome small subunit-dependent GTPase A [Candidatus Hydrogenedentes bacterium]|nr:ribosome small subunit-dependent GTPase A [Candidatus Hydrogenedentota bacterium]
MSFGNDARAQVRPGQELARVCVSQGERARVLLGGAELEAVVAGALLYAAESAAELPVTGDWVAVRRVDPELVLIERVLERRSKIARRAPGRRGEEQVLAANVDVALLMAGLDGDFNRRRIERYLALAREGGVTPVVVLNKADVAEDAGARREEARQVARGVEVLVVSARTGAGCGAVEALLAHGVTAVLLGSSGAGKSTLLNRLLGMEVQRTGAIRESDGRGRHTTTHRELIELGSGAALIDTPGLREVQLWASEESVAAVFEEVAELAGECRYRDCSHTREPGCAVREGVDAARLESFQKLRREAERLSGELTEKQRWRSIHKAARQFYKLRGR